MRPQDFLDMLVPAAQACQRATGIPASFTLAQAALESSWGARAPGCNLFGIKADKSWKGAVVSVVTKEEFTKGVKTVITANFRCYRNWDESLADRAEYLRIMPRYKDCFKETTGHGWARAVAKAGYATDSKYAETLIAVMDGRNMSRFDKLPSEVK
ncbi:MAG: glucosaminidase domain-containing protein [Massilia sp.]